MSKTNDKIRVLNILTNIVDGGLEMIVYKINKGLDKDKFIPDLCTLQKVENSFIVNNFRNVCDNIYSLSFRNKNLKLKDYVHNFFQLLKLTKLIIKNKYDIVHSHDFFSPFYTRIAVIFCKMLIRTRPSRVFITYHNIYYWLKPIHHFINRILSGVTDNIVCVTKSVKDYAIQKEKIKENKFIVIYNGIKSEEFYSDKLLRESARNNLGYNLNDFVIGNVGVYSERKGQIYLLEAFNNLLKNYKNLKLTLIGSSRDFELSAYNELIRFVDDNKLDNYVKFVGTTKEINKLYNVLDLYVMPSVTEGFGLALYEAMLVDKLCVCSDIPPFKELIVNGQNGFLFESKNSKSLTEVLDHVIKNIDKFEDVKTKGRNFVKTELSEEKMILSYIKLYDI